MATALDIFSNNTETVIGRSLFHIGKPKQLVSVNGFQWSRMRVHNELSDAQIVDNVYPNEDIPLEIAVKNIHRDKERALDILRLSYKTISYDDDTNKFFNNTTRVCPPFSSFAELVPMSLFFYTPEEYEEYTELASGCEQWKTFTITYSGVTFYVGNFTRLSSRAFTKGFRGYRFEIFYEMLFRNISKVSADTTALQLMVAPKQASDRWRKALSEMGLSEYFALNLPIRHYESLLYSALSDIGTANFITALQSFIYRRSFAYIIGTDIYSNSMSRSYDSLSIPYEPEDCFMTSMITV